MYDCGVCLLTARQCGLILVFFRLAHWIAISRGFPWRIWANLSKGKPESAEHIDKNHKPEREKGRNKTNDMTFYKKAKYWNWKIEQRLFRSCKMPSVGRFRHGGSKSFEIWETCRKSNNPMSQQVILHTQSATNISSHSLNCHGTSINTPRC